MDKHSNQPESESSTRQLDDRKRVERPPTAKRPTQRSMEGSLMWVAAIAGLVFMILGAAVALWIFVSFSK